MLYIQILQDMLTSLMRLTFLGQSNFSYGNFYSYEKPPSTIFDLITYIMAWQHLFKILPKLPRSWKEEYFYKGNAYALHTVCQGK